MPHQGENLGKYKLIRRIGLGGMAEVWLARVTGPGGFSKTLVVKTVLEHHAQNQDFIAQFFDEARLAALLTHPNIAQIFELGEQDGVHYIAMEYVRGKDLHVIRKEAVARGDGLPFPLLARIACGVCEGLHNAHELTDDQGKPLGLVHRDVSPENILVSYDGVVKIVDFGIAKATINQVTTKAGIFKGKLRYTAPQRLLDLPIDRRDDIYSFGAVLYKTITGHVPINADSDGAMIKAILDGEFPPPREIEPSIPDEFEAIVLKAMAWDPNDRYATTREMQQDLERYIATAGQPVTTFDISQLLRKLFAEELEKAHTLNPPEEETRSEAVDPGTVVGLGGQQRDVPAQAGTILGHPVDNRPPLPVPESEPRAETQMLMAGWKPSRFRGVAAFALVVLLLATGVIIGAWAPWRDSGAISAEGSSLAQSHAVGGGPLVPEAIEEQAEEDTGPPSTPRDTNTGGLFGPAPRPLDSAADASLAHLADGGIDGASAQPATGTLVLRGPPGCAGHLGDEELGDLPLTRALPVGEQEVVVRCSSGARRELDLVIRAGDETTETVRLGEGSLQILVRPWAEVYIGGQKRGITPMAPLSLTEGRYAVRLVNNDLGVSETRRVRIRPGQRQTLRVRLR